MGLSTRAEFLKPATRRHREFSLPVSGAKVRIRSLTEGEKEAYEAEMLTSDGKPSRERLQSARRRLVVLCLVDGSGQRLLSDADLDSLRDLDGADLAVIQEEIQTHVGFKPGDLESLVGNSGTAPAAVSP